MVMMHIFDLQYNQALKFVSRVIYISYHNVWEDQDYACRRLRRQGIPSSSP
jgi:hypothetical protein